MRIKPNYQDMGLSICMGQELRAEVKRQLIKDLNQYHLYTNELRFDWSDSCIEGKRLKYMDGSLENFSGIMLFNQDDQIVADGWMDFYYSKEQDRLIVYWEFLDIYIDDKVMEIKTKPGMPDYIKSILED